MSLLYFTRKHISIKIDQLKFRASPVEKSIFTPERKHRWKLVNWSIPKSKSNLQQIPMKKKSTIKSFTENNRYMMMHSWKWNPPHQRYCVNLFLMKKESYQIDQLKLRASPVEKSGKNQFAPQKGSTVESWWIEAFQKASEICNKSLYCT